MSKIPSSRFAGAGARKGVLRVDGYPTKRDLRSIRRLGVDVDAASDIAQTRALWQADSYSLVLVDAHYAASDLPQFCASIPPPDVRGARDEMVVAMYANACVALPTRYGFQEASWRIAATRSLKDLHPGYAVASAGTPNRGADKKHPQFSWMDAVNRHSEKSAS
jgi:hypothetical protein